MTEMIRVEWLELQGFYSLIYYVRHIIERKEEM